MTKRSKTNSNIDSKYLPKSSKRNSKYKESTEDYDSRHMKSSDQLKILENEFDKDPHWGKDKMKKVAKLLNLKVR